MLLYFCMFWFAMYLPRPSMLAFMHISLYSIYTYTVLQSICMYWFERYSIFTMHVFYFSLIDMRTQQIKCISLLFLSSLLAFLSPFLFLKTTYPLLLALFSPHLSLHPSFSTLPSIFLLLTSPLAPTQTAQREDGAEKTQWSGQHLGGPCKGKASSLLQYKTFYTKLLKS